MRLCVNSRYSGHYSRDMGDSTAPSAEKRAHDAENPSSAAVHGNGTMDVEWNSIARSEYVVVADNSGKSFLSAPVEAFSGKFARFPLQVKLWSCRRLRIIHCS